MSGVVPVVPRFRFNDANGNPLANGSVTVYLAGTTTLASTYQDKALSVANTNPVSLDGNGECLFWVSDSYDYKFLLKDSNGATVSGWPVDNIPSNKPNDFVSVKRFGAVGDGSTDDTTAFTSALTYLAAISPWSVSTSRGQLKPRLYLPAGVYKVSSTQNVNFRGFEVYGDGWLNSVIAWYGGNAPVFDIGTFSATPSDIFSGGYQDVRFRDLRIQHASPGASGSRSGQAIRCSGGGGLRTHSVAVFGFAYGLNSPYGGDFNSYYDTNIEFCDVGVYQGPGGQQWYTNNLQLYNCREGMVIDRCGQCHHEMPIFVNPEVAGVVLEATGNTSTRQLTLFSMTGVSYQSQMVFNSPWLEGNAGNLGDAAVPTHFFQCNDNGADAYRDITINNPKILAGAATKTTTSYFANTGAFPAQRVRHNNIVFNGTMTRFLTAPNGDIITNYRVETGYTPPAFANNTAYDVVETGTTRTLVRRSDIMGHIQTYEDKDGTQGTRITFDNNGIVSYAFKSGGSYLTRFGMDVQNRRLHLGDPASDICITRSNAMPTTGAFVVGSFVFNTAPTVAAGKTLLGWQRLTTGSAHVAGTDWSPCFVTNT